MPLIHWSMIRYLLSYVFFHTLDAMLFFWLLRRLSYSKEDQESRVDRLAGDEAETFVLPLAHAEWGFHRYTLCAIRCLAGKHEWSFWIDSEHRCFLNSWAMMRTGRTLIQECHFWLLSCTVFCFWGWQSECSFSLICRSELDWWVVVKYVDIEFEHRFLK